MLYRSPPGDLATVLAFGREYQVGTDLGPPLAFWLADIAFRAAGNHMFGVYLLAQVCNVAALWTLYLLARAIVGGQQAVLAVLLYHDRYRLRFVRRRIRPAGAGASDLGAVVAAYLATDRPEPAQRPGSHGQSKPGLLLLTTSAAPALLLLVAGFALATVRGRRTLMSFDPLYALLVIAVLVLPYLVWVIRANVLVIAAMAGDR